MNRALPLSSLLLAAACATSPAGPTTEAQPRCPELTPQTADRTDPLPGPHLRASLDGEPVRVTYWVVATEVEPIVGRTVPQEIAKAIDGRVPAGASLTLLDSSAIESMPELGAFANGSHSKFEQVVHRSGSPMVLDVQIETSLHTRLDSRVSVAPGEPTLVGSSAYRHRTHDAPDNVGEVFYVIKAEPAARASTVAAK